MCEDSIKFHLNFERPLKGTRYTRPETKSEQWHELFIRNSFLVHAKFNNSYVDKKYNNLVEHPDPALDKLCKESSTTSINHIFDLTKLNNSTPISKFKHGYIQKEHDNYLYHTSTHNGEYLAEFDDGTSFKYKLENDYKKNLLVIPFDLEYKFSFRFYKNGYKSYFKSLIETIIKYFNWVIEYVTESGFFNEELIKEFIEIIEENFLLSLDGTLEEFIKKDLDNHKPIPNEELAKEIKYHFVDGLFGEGKTEYVNKQTNSPPFEFDNIYRHLFHNFPEISHDLIKCFAIFSYVLSFLKYTIFFNEQKNNDYNFYFYRIFSHNFFDYQSLTKPTSYFKSKILIDQNFIAGLCFNIECYHNILDSQKTLNYFDSGDLKNFPHLECFLHLPAGNSIWNPNNSIFVPSPIKSTRTMEQNLYLEKANKNEYVDNKILLKTFYDFDAYIGFILTSFSKAIYEGLVDIFEYYRNVDNRLIKKRSRSFNYIIPNVYTSINEASVFFNGSVYGRFKIIDGILTINEELGNIF